MKKLFVTFLIVSMLCILYACSPGEGLTAQVSLPERFTCEMKVTSGEKDYLCSFTRDNDGYILSVNSPNELKGLTLSCENGKYACELGEASFDPGDSIEKHFFSRLISALTDFSKKSGSTGDRRGDGYTFKGRSDKGMYELTFGINGELSGIKLYDPQALIEITEFTVEKS